VRHPVSVCTLAKEPEEEEEENQINLMERRRRREKKKSDAMERPTSAHTTIGKTNDTRSDSHQHDEAQSEKR
jgi:hypothetical protein